MADEEKAIVPTEEPTGPSVFIAGADTGIGLFLVGELVRRGCTVTGTTDRGAQGANDLRAAGAVPVYPDLTRAGEIRSALHLGKAQITINLTPQAFNGSPQHALAAADPAVLRQISEAMVDAASAVSIQRMIHVGMAAAYGDHGDTAVDESAHLSSSNALYQALSEAEAAVLDGGIPGYGLRAGFVYGGYNNATRELAHSLRAGRSLLPGEGTASWVHEDDLVSAIVKLVLLPLGSDSTPAAVYNLAGDETASPNAFVAILAQEMGLGKPGYMPAFIAGLRSGAVRGDLLQQSLILSTEKARTELEWAPQYPTITAGLARSLLVWRAEMETTVS